MADLACRHWLGVETRHCGAVPAQPYTVGLRCREHTPAALAGRPEPGQGAYCPPGYCLCRGCPHWRPEMTPLDAIDVDLAAQLRAGIRDPGHQLAKAVAAELTH